MTSRDYNPFSAPLHDFPPEELAKLRDVHEGWFVDYKAKPITAAKFAKSLSAFANQFGGWLFVGIQESSDNHPTAESFPGVKSADVDNVLVQVREGVSAHVSPDIYFESRIIAGPVDSIGLPDGFCIVVIKVPEGPNPPIVHSSGCIYRRIADSSAPKAETDRAVLDQMWRKSDSLRTRLADFVSQPVADIKVNNAYCYVYLMEDLTLSSVDEQLTISDFREAMTSTDQDDAASALLDNIYSTQDGFIARYGARSHDPLIELPSLRWWRNGNVRLTIPINLINVSSYSHTTNPLLKSFKKEMGSRSGDYHRVVDLDQWLAFLFALTYRFMRLRQRNCSTAQVSGKVALHNVRRVTPFISMETYLAMVRENGIPVCQDATTTYPASHATAFAPLGEGRTEPVDAVGLVWPLLFGALRSLGIDFQQPADAASFARELSQAVRGGSQGQPAVDRS